jgi:hypothetical protein
VNKPVIVIGSVVSFDVAPTVDVFLREFLKLLSERSLSYPSTSRYCPAKWMGMVGRQAFGVGDKNLTRTQLMVSKTLDHGVGSLKFEEVLRHCQESGIDIHKIVSATYKTTSFNSNHLALAYLIKTKRYVVLTTNFDNAIEHAGDVESIMGPFPVADVIKANVSPLLYKLHGCAAKAGTIVATTGTLLSAKELQAFEFIQELCRGATVHMFGYSGTGDIDIAPHFEKIAQASDIRWNNHQNRKPPFIGQVVLCNLKSNSVDSNTLLKLAVQEGWTHADVHGEPWAKGELEKVISEIPPLVAWRAITRIFGILEHQVRLIDHHLSISLALDKLILKTYLDWHGGGRKDPGPLATASHLETMRLTNLCRERYPGYADTWDVFCLWRLGKVDAALELAQKILDNKKSITLETLRTADTVLWILAERLLASPPKRRALILEEESGLVASCFSIIEQVDENIISLELKFGLKASRMQYLSWCELITNDANSTLKTHFKELERLAEELQDAKISSLAIRTHMAWKALVVQSGFATSRTELLERKVKPANIIEAKKLFAYSLPRSKNSYRVFRFIEISILPFLNYATDLHSKYVRFKLRLSLAGK